MKNNPVGAGRVRPGNGRVRPGKEIRPSNKEPRGNGYFRKGDSACGHGLNSILGPDRIPGPDSSGPYRVVSFLFSFFILFFFCRAAQSAEWRKAAPGYAWSFPRDHWAHRDFKNEWWYFTGLLETDEQPPRHFGYQFTLFRLGSTRDPAGGNSVWKTGQTFMGHAALSDFAANRHRFSEVFFRESALQAGFPAEPDATLAWSLPPAGTSLNRAARTNGWTLRWNDRAFDFSAQDDGQQYGFRLTTQPAKPLIYEGPGGFSRKTADGSTGSNYYSFTRLKTEGTLQIDGKTVRVRGESWMDKEFGSEAMGKGQKGWDWFSLQFNDGTELMLYLMRRPDGSVDFASGTAIDRAGHARYLSANDFAVSATDHWKSPASGARYPSRWHLQVGAQSLEVLALLADQENVARHPAMAYWEGAVEIRDAQDSTAGHGYVELTGY